MVQQLLIALLFLAAVAYLGYQVYAHFKSDYPACAKGCSCASIDIDKIEQEIKKQQEQEQVQNPSGQA